MIKFLLLAVVVCVVDIALANPIQAPDCSGGMHCIKHVQSGEYIVYPKAGGHPRMATKEEMTSDESCRICYANITSQPDVPVDCVIVAVDSAINENGQTLKGVLYHNGQSRGGSGEMVQAHVQTYTGNDDGERFARAGATGGIRLVPKVNNSKALYAVGCELVLDDYSSSNDWQVFTED